MKFTSPYVNKASDWSLNKNKPIRGFVYIRACEFHYELLNFTTKFGTKFATFTEKLYEINCNVRFDSKNIDILRAINALNAGSDTYLDLSELDVLPNTFSCLNINRSILELEIERVD